MEYLVTVHFVRCGSVCCHFIINLDAGEAPTELVTLVSVLMESKDVAEVAVSRRTVGCYSEYELVPHLSSRGFSVQQRAVAGDGE